MVRNATATSNMLLADKRELAAYMDTLAGELLNYEASADPVVNFGHPQTVPAGRDQTDAIGDRQHAAPDPGTEQADRTAA